MNRYLKSITSIKASLNLFTISLLKELFCVQQLAGMNMAKSPPNPEKRNRVMSHLQKIINNDGQEVCDKTEIRQKLKQFCSSLYKRRSNKTVDECMSYLANMNIPKLTDEEKLSCEGKLTKNECWIALFSIGNNNSPGNEFV